MKRFQEIRPEQLIDALLRTLRQVLEGLELHAVQGDAAERDRFRADMRKIQDDLSNRPAPSEVLAAGDTVVKALEDYHGCISRLIHSQCAELQATAGILTKAMATLAGSSETGVGRLEALEKHLEMASIVESLQTVRLRLSECREELRGEIVRQREHSAQAVSELKAALEKSQGRPAPPIGPGKEKRRTDPVTGLPGRPEAEATLLEISQENRPAYAVLLVVERLELINMRFGYAAGDQVLLLVSQHVAQSLSGNDALFRWSGPSLLALLEHRDSEKEVREEVEWITSQRLEKTITVAGRTVLLPVAANWVIFTVAEYRPVQSLFQQLDLFVQSKTAGAVVSA